MHLILRHLLLSGLGVGAVCVVALTVRLLSPRDAVIRYRLMVSALFTAALLIPLQAFTAELSARPATDAIAAPVRASASIPGAGRALPSGEVGSTTGRPGDAWAPEAVSPRRAHAGVGRAPLLMGIYLAGLVAVVGFQAVRAASVWRLLRGARPVSDPRVLRNWERIVANAEQPPELLECDRLHAPACRAIGRAAVIVPSGSGALDDDTLAAALRHELIHLRRHDGAIALQAAALTALVWFQPLVWAFARVLRADREHSCDALVVRVTGQPRSYALALLRYCDRSASPRRAAPLIGFESARSIRRRITMLAHALQPAARPYRAVVLGVGSACLVSASAAHALLTAAAGPGPAMSATGVAGADGASRIMNDGTRASPRMTAEVRANPDGRSESQVLERLLKLGAISPSDLPRREPWWAFDDANEKSVGVNAPKKWITDQETVLSAEDASIDGNTLHARRVRLSLPEGSKLRAVFEGQMVNFEPGARGGTRIVVTGGTVRIVDDSGVTRIDARADSPRDDVVLVLTSTADGGEFNFDLAAGDGLTPLRIGVDGRSAGPDGQHPPAPTTSTAPPAPPHPPHGSVRWNLRTPEGGPGACELKMQWIYDINQLARQDGC